MLIGCRLPDVDHVIFRGDLLCHVPPCDERNTLLRGWSCIVDATGWVCMKIE